MKPADLALEFRCIRCGELTPWAAECQVQTAGPRGMRLLHRLCAKCAAWLCRAVIDVEVVPPELALAIRDEKIEQLTGTVDALNAQIETYRQELKI